ncbi:39S ribosomal protein L27, mitochondrial [Folsomia candida]|uniref:39S ribosomal protein L27, mitochondrial n=1 Tax=Folsomia candida TaxID=158441 RepID=UPI000B9092D0|nr:39S ribosomal protein L27, mitochondrial [Folsomia candida]
MSGGQFLSKLIPSILVGAVTAIGKPGTVQSLQPVRFASKKAAGGGNKNPKQAPGNFKGIKIWDGWRANPRDIIVHKQTRLWFHPGLNVRLAGRLNLVALKTGTVSFTVETPDLNWKHRQVEKFYGARSRTAPFFKKYVHVIPDKQHNQFRLVDMV